MVDPEIWKPIPDEHVGPAEFLSERKERGQSDSNTEIAKQDELRVLCFVQWAVLVEVVDAREPSILLALATTFALVLVVVVAGDIGDQVQWPSCDLLSNQVQQARNWCLFGQLMQLMSKLANSRSIFLSSFWHKDHITLHVASGLVVLAMRYLP